MPNIQYYLHPEFIIIPGKNYSTFVKNRLRENGDHKKVQLLKQDQSGAS